MEVEHRNVGLYSVPYGDPLLTRRSAIYLVPQALEIGAQRREYLRIVVHE
jgi:hypothetical protein